MKVTVIMGVYNPPIKEQLDYAVDSILKQTLTDFEFLIVDDGSNNETHHWLLEYANLDSRIKIIKKEKNEGLAAALNLCVSVAKGKYIARMDADDYSYPNRFQTQYDFLEANDQYSIVGCNAELIQNNETWGERKMPEKPREADFLPYSPFIHPSVMINKEIFDICGGYQEGKETWRSEDYEIFMRMYTLGYRGYNLQKNLFQYREDVKGYQKRKYKYRIDEAKIRKRHFKNLNVSNYLKIVYTMKPLVVGLVPMRVIQYLKHIQGRKEMYEAQNNTAKKISWNTPKLSENITQQQMFNEFSYQEQNKA